MRYPLPDYSTSTGVSVFPGPEGGRAVGCPADRQVRRNHSTGIALPYVSDPKPSGCGPETDRLPERLAWRAFVQHAGELAARDLLASPRFFREQDRPWKGGGVRSRIIVRRAAHSAFLDFGVIPLLRGGRAGRGLWAGLDVLQFSPRCCFTDFSFLVGQGMDPDCTIVDGHKHGGLCRLDTGFDVAAAVVTLVGDHSDRRGQVAPGWTATCCSSPWSVQ